MNELHHFPNENRSGREFLETFRHLRKTQRCRSYSDFDLKEWIRNPNFLTCLSKKRMKDLGNWFLYSSRVIMPLRAGCKDFRTCWTDPRERRHYWNEACVSDIPSIPLFWIKALSSLSLHLMNSKVFGIGHVRTPFPLLLILRVSFSLS